MSTTTPEALARDQIDRMLVAAGWTIQDYKQLHLGAPFGIALREDLVWTTSTLADSYALGVYRKLSGIARPN
jgi:type I restriction enzyme R subunit